MKFPPYHSNIRLSPFTFACKLNGIYVSVAVFWVDEEYSIQINGIHTASLQLAEDGNTWIVSEGALNDDVFIKEIGDWIEARYY